MDTKHLAIILAVVGVASVLYMQHEAPSLSADFKLWKQKYGVKYDTVMQEQYREKIFLANLAKIEAHNADEYKTYTTGINKFSDLTQEEFVEMYLGLIIPEEKLSSIDTSSDDVYAGDVDWTTKGAVTDIKDQGQCGSCWAFSTTGSLEGLSFLSKGQLQSFSEQQLVDCSFLIYGNLGCNGGMMDNAFKYVMAKGIVHEDEYPYVAKVQGCKVPGGDFKISGFTDIKACSDLANGLNERPISVAVDATNWQTYKSGVFNNCDAKLNHGVLLVGMSNDYWRVKNSWTTQWGEQGYIRLARGNTCGICNVASYPNA